MKVKPILFSTAMVQAILEGRKTQTRRIVKGKTEHFVKIEVEHDGSTAIPYVRGAGAQLWAEPYIKPKYQVGDVLWVRETFNINRISGVKSLNISYEEGQCIRENLEYDTPYWITVNISELNEILD